MGYFYLSRSYISIVSSNINYMKKGEGYGKDRNY